LSKSSIAFGLWLVVWIGILCVGLGLYTGVVEQHVPGYPNSGQFNLLFVYPGCWMAVNLVFLLLTKRIPLPVKLLTVVLQVPAVFLFFFIASGGV
jgi:hypothetical protein